MGYLSNLKNCLRLAIFPSLTMFSLRVQRRQSFGPSEAFPVSVHRVTPQPQSLPSPPPSPGLQPLMVDQSNTTATATPSLPPPPRSIAELAIPAALSVAIYGSIPSNIQLDPGSILYPPLIAFISLAVLTSLGTIVYALANPDGGAGAGAESAKQRAMGIAFVFSLVAFVLRVLLLPATSMGLAGSVILVGAAVMVVLFFLLWKKEEIHDRVAVAPEPEPEPATDSSV